MTSAESSAKAAINEAAGRDGPHRDRRPGHTADRFRRSFAGYALAGPWFDGDQFSLVDCDYGPVFNVIDKAGFSFSDYPRVRSYLEAIRSRRAWQETPKLPGL